MPSNFLNNYFGFNKQQRNGLFVLICICLFLLAIRLVYPFFIKPDSITLLNLPLLERKPDSVSAIHPYTDNGVAKPEKKISRLFVFDPNTVNLTQLLELGFKEKTAQVFLKFRAKGFVFREKKDLLKVYGIRQDFFVQLEPYILIAESPSSKSFFKNEIPKMQDKEASSISKPMLELNSADSISLISLNGIGATYTKRILKYRDLLGGFVSVEQLQEVYGFSLETYEKVKNLCYVDRSTVKKLNLNKADFKTLNKHPYLSYQLTRNIFEWRKKTIINSTNLKDILNDPGLYQKLLPYLSFEQ